MLDDLLFNSFDKWWQLSVREIIDLVCFRMIEYLHKLLANIDALKFLPVLFCLVKIQVLGGLKDLYFYCLAKNIYFVNTEARSKCKEESNNENWTSI